MELDQSVSPEFARMTDASPSTLERDRRAILAMAGNFRTSFDFIETVGFEADYKPARPYQSWGTEFVTVVENSEKFISRLINFSLFSTTVTNSVPHDW